MLFLYTAGATCICRWLLPMYICHQWQERPSRLPDLNPNKRESASKVHSKGKSDPGGIYEKGHWLECLPSAASCSRRALILDHFRL